MTLGLQLSSNLHILSSEYIVVSVVLSTTVSKSLFVRISDLDLRAIPRTSISEDGVAKP